MANTSNRRSFFSKGIKSVLAVGIGTSVMEANAQQVGDKVKLLTSDGKLVELDQEVLDQSRTSGIKQKATSQEIIDWSEQIKS